ncbi:MAG TPA: hypothetical protein EYQ63_13100 [Fuerstia sp.]|nr:hypothetical protein [Fuerstiella sp.]
MHLQSLRKHLICHIERTLESLSAAVSYMNIKTSQTNPAPKKNRLLPLLLLLVSGGGLAAVLLVLSDVKKS